MLVQPITGGRCDSPAFNFSKKGDTMASRNVETLRAAHDNWNRRDFAGVIRDTAEGFVYTDTARGLNLDGRDKFREWTEAWAKAFSDARIVNPEYIDAGDIVVARFYHRRHQRRDL
jgi:ketosteroid isomerase-like protein